jgi:hypothetical protein
MRFIKLMLFGPMSFGSSVTHLPVRPEMAKTNVIDSRRLSRRTLRCRCSARALRSLGSATRRRPASSLRDAQSQKTSHRTFQDPSGLPARAPPQDARLVWCLLSPEELAIEVEFDRRWTVATNRRDGPQDGTSANIFSSQRDDSRNCGAR